MELFLQAILPNILKAVTFIFHVFLPWALASASIGLLLFCLFEEYKRRRQFTAMEAAAHAHRREQLDAIRRRFQATLEADSAHQEFIDSTHVRSVDDLVHSATTTRPSTPFPQESAGTECGNVQIFSCRAYSISAWDRLARYTGLEPSSQGSWPPEAYSRLSPPEVYSCDLDSCAGELVPPLELARFDRQTLEQLKHFERQAKMHLVRQEKRWDLSMNHAEPPCPHIYIDFAPHSKNEGHQS
jgi:hypothetical protein